MPFPLPLLHPTPFYNPGNLNTELLLHRYAGSLPWDDTPLAIELRVYLFVDSYLARHMYTRAEQLHVDVEELPKFAPPLTDDYSRLHKHFELAEKAALVASDMAFHSALGWLDWKEGEAASANTM